MKRDDVYLRELLFRFEVQPDFLVGVSNSLNASPEQRKEKYHVQLLCDAGMMTQISKSTYRITSQGHDYLDAIRPDTVWSKTQLAVSEIGGATLGIMKDLAVSDLKQEAAEKLSLNL